jgi:hypothetical protein
MDVFAISFITSVLKTHGTETCSLFWSRVFSLLKPQDMDREKHYFEQAQKIAKLSTWEYNVENEEIFLTPENYKTFEIQVGKKMPNELIMELVPSLGR